MYKLLISMVIFTFFGSCILPVENARILAISIIGSKSHWNFMSGVLRALTDEGHSVTFFTPFPIGNRENCTEVDMSGKFEKILDVDVEEMVKLYGDPIATLNTMVGMSREFCDTVYANHKLKEILKTGPQSEFDLVLIKPFESTCVTYAAIKLKLPMIYVETLPFACFLQRATSGHSSNPAVVSHYFANHAIPKTFVQRFTNTFLWLYGSVIMKYQELLIKYILKLNRKNMICTHLFRRL